MSASKKKITGFFIITIFAALLGIFSLKSGFLSSYENHTWDRRVRFVARETYHDPDIKIIIIDQQSLDYFNKHESIRWPFPRALYVPVIKFLERAGARAVAFDILYTEPSVYGADDDNEFARASAAKIPVVHALALSRSDNKPDTEKLKLLKAATSVNQSSELSELLEKIKAPHYNSAVLPVKPLLKNTRYFGSVTAAPDSDGIFRHYRPGGFLQNIPVGTLPFALYATSAGSGWQKKIARFVDASGNLTVKFYGGAKTFHTDNIVNIINSEIALEQGRKPIVDPLQYKDSWVFVGVWAPGLLDLRPVAVDRAYRGVEFNATVLNNIIKRDFFIKLPAYLNYVFIFLVTAYAAGSILLISSEAGKALAILLGSILFVACGYGTALAGYWLQMAAPFVSLLAAFILSLALQYQLEGRQHRFIKKAFSQYVSPAVIRRIIENPSALSLGGEKRELTMFFSDLEGFTTLSERLEAGKLGELINEYLDSITEVILSYEGTLDKYEGDAIVAFWNAPVAIEDHARRGVLAALEAQNKLSELRDYFREKFGVTLRMRVGINTGTVNVGNFGSRNRFDYTIIGDAANLAARLEGVNKVFGTSILISEATRKKLPGDILCRRVADLRVVGKSEVVRVYEPLTAGSSEADRLIEITEKALSALERGRIDEAIRNFKLIEEDCLAQAYIRRINELSKGGELTASGPFIWNLTSK